MQKDSPPNTGVPEAGPSPSPPGVAQLTVFPVTPQGAGQQHGRKVTFQLYFLNPQNITVTIPTAHERTFYALLINGPPAHFNSR